MGFYTFYKNSELLAVFEIIEWKLAPTFAKEGINSWSIIPVPIMLINGSLFLSFIFLLFCKKKYLVFASQF